MINLLFLEGMQLSFLALANGAAPLRAGVSLSAVSNQLL